MTIISLMPRAVPVGQKGDVFAWLNSAVIKYGKDALYGMSVLRYCVYTPCFALLE